ncbi:MAG: adenosylcobinamide-GDP ribazoletransferase [Nitrospirota bacterium]
MTVVPITVKGEVTEAHMARSVLAYPLVGLLQGAAAALGYALLERLFPPSVAVALAVLLLSAVSGGFHLDGLADTFDALASKGDRERKLAIMREGSVGAIGAAAVVFSLGIKYLALRSLADLGPAAFYGALVFMPMLSKWSMVAGMYHGAPARKDGLGRLYIESTGAGRFFSVTAMALAFMSLGALLAGRPPLFVLFNLPVLLALYLLAAFLRRFFRSRLGGLTGDTLGAQGEITESVFLLAVLGWSRLYTS